ncbi:methylated-DNA--[protein]-cysteine S-methyltransferase [Knoellia subterranea]|uniref:Methylated-DNA--protein-cysteine methyltransferase n=1 Tax=Knoellia subterranea KCTC 19937 TaxID=1385521 RepID=A0A0A0JM55_9MICO|nr:methylated-DNA--[protein]-cysteine S-methyltransferase [Knoellia subterranea]KGN37122.1 methylated-DNA--protein-cysteine methyltransferase [Knoellia subterranea KCTC 19937]
MNASPITAVFDDFAPAILPPVLPESDVSYAVEDTAVGRLLLAVRADGRLVTSAYVADSDTEDAWLQRLSDHVSPRVLRHTRPLDTARRELAAYLSGKATTFSVPVDLVLASDFQRSVLDGLRARVGYGASTTYGELAAAIDRPRASRAVGTALGGNPLCVFVPCHRVLPAGGSVVGGVRNVGGYAGGPAAKEYLLTLEAGSSGGSRR